MHRTYTMSNVSFDDNQDNTLEDNSGLIKKQLLPLSISTFPKLVEGNYLYVDKTRYIYNLLVQKGAYFLSRPRRFGKSLLVSTLKEIFKGNRELFKEYWIYNKIQWEKCPVVHLDFQGIDFKKLGLEKGILNKLNRIAGEYGIGCEGDSISERFENLIDKLAGETSVAVLIDEYDKPVTDYIENIEKAEENREILKNFYSVLKSRQENIRFLLMTGVSRFSRLSVFSDLNHLIDITFHDDYVKLLGYTQEEIETYFDRYIEQYLRENPGLSKEGLFRELKAFYNGYSWDGKIFVYNPFSIINFFDFRKFKSFWFTSGTPTFLIKMVRTHGIDFKVWEELKVNEQFFDKFDISNINITLLLFQTGYLTIKRVEDSMYVLSYPNHEVKNALLYHLLEEYSGIGQEMSGSFILDIKDFLAAKNINGLIARMKALYASIPFNLVEGDVERYYHLVFYLVMKLAAGKSQPEYPGHRGRMDLVVESEKYIYIFEFKMTDAQKALDQINQKGYYEQFLVSKKQIILVGVGFSKEERNISGHAYSEIG